MLYSGSWMLDEGTSTLGGLTLRQAEHREQVAAGIESRPGAVSHPNPRPLCPSL